MTNQCRLSPTERAEALSELLSAQNLTVFRGDRCLFQGVSFALNPGESLLVQGQNGSGKTTLLRALAGLLDLEEGTVNWRGAPTLANRQQYHGELAWFAHRVGFKNDLSLHENLSFEPGLRSMSLDRLDEALKKFGLAAIRHLPFRSLSAGQQRRSGLARMLLTKARLWLMDEPFTNLDTAGQKMVVGLIQDHLDRGGACVVASHHDVELDSAMQRIDL